MSKIKVAMVDDQALIREGLKSLLSLSDKIDVVSQASDGEEAIAQLKSGLDAEVLLLDIRMPKATGIDVLKFMQAENINIPALILTTFDDHDLIMQGMQSGAKGYLLKDISLEHLVDAIEKVVAGELVIQPALTERLMQSFNQPNESTKAELVEPLTDKELEILKLIANGFANKEIAETLFNAEGTIRNQVSVILAKLNVRDRTRAVLKAIELGLF
ncbi:response regulator transcription factor [Catenovulum sp. SM1970]|uniref:response regulator n=1 Tax=Marinifaba aquimaris TaxID=2741323 RepID=UPI00157255F2|nr:response regulator transcription factor [Marinifaba aquimaris]NTS78649.1 response regulator transcription factor [Marinifaba aquimaris]